MSKWWRAHDEALNNPKLQKLSADLFRCWFNLMCIASAHVPRGHLPSMADIAFRLRLPPSRTSRLVEELVKCELLHTSATGQLRVHDWDTWQYESDTDPTNADRQRRFRDRRRKVTGSNDVSNGDVTRYGNDQNRTEQNAAEADQVVIPLRAATTPSLSCSATLPSLTPSPGAPPPSPRAVPDSPQAYLFARGKEVLGANAGGLISMLLKKKRGDVEATLRVIELATQKQDPKEYVAAVVHGKVYQSPDWREFLG